jgi:hypothetical protein
MPSDLKYNGVGTFYPTVQMPAFSGANGGLLEQRWGSRMVEMSGRVRGMSGSVSVPFGQAATVNFPAGYFSFTPLVDAMALMPKAAIDYYDGQMAAIRFGKFQTFTSSRLPGGGQASVDLLIPTGTLAVSNYYLPIELAPVYIRKVNILPTSVVFTSDASMYGELQLPWAKMRFKDLLNEPIMVFWHAFGC